jgi:hypothetical protein
MLESNGVSLPQITIDAATSAKLLGLGEPMEFCDEAGNVLGHFTPDEKSPAFRAWLRNLDHGLSPEEVERRCTTREGFSTEEVIARLRASKA